jgi:hypothetical protein
MFVRPRGITIGSFAPVTTVGDFWKRYGLSRVSPALRSQMPGAVTAGDACSGAAPARCCCAAMPAVCST